MKRSELVLRLQDQLNSQIEDLIYRDYETGETDIGGFNNYQADVVLTFLEELGMQPPLSQVKLVSDPTRKGTMMHTEAKREWDNE